MTSFMPDQTDQAEDTCVKGGRGESHQAMGCYWIQPCQTGLPTMLTGPVIGGFHLPS